MIIPNIWENKIDVPNHQPETDLLDLLSQKKVDLSGIVDLCSVTWVTLGFSLSSEYFGRPLRAANATMFAEED